MEFIFCAPMPQPETENFHVFDLRTAKMEIPRNGSEYEKEKCASLSHTFWALKITGS